MLLLPPRRNAPSSNGAAGCRRRPLPSPTRKCAGRIRRSSSRVPFASAFFFLGLAALIAERLFLRAMVRAWARQGRLDRRTIIVGSDHNGERLVEALKAQDDSDIHIL